MHPYLFVFAAFLLFSCSQNKTNKSADNAITENTSFNLKSTPFDDYLIEELYKNLNDKFKVSFQAEHLHELLDGVAVEDLKSGKIIKKTMLFEHCDCECFDKMKLSYSKLDDKYVLYVYEELYEESLDWCPESSALYSFKLKDNTILELNLDFAAG